MKTVRAKFRCENINSVEHGSEILLRPVTCGSEENERFFELTPWGAIQLATVNEEAAAQFEIGKEYYVDFTGVE